MLSVVLALVLAACADDDDGDQNPDEATFCRLALVNEPVAEADAPVLARLAELAPGEVDAAVDVLWDAAEEIAEHPPLSPEAVALEFEVRLRDDYVAARAAVDEFLDLECRDEADLDDDLDGDDLDKREEKRDEVLDVPADAP